MPGSSLDRIARRLGLPTFRPPWRLPTHIHEYEDASKFTSITSMLEFNMYWEAKAIEGYLAHSRRALILGDVDTARMFNHILSEEDHHLSELAERWKKISG